MAALVLVGWWQDLEVIKAPVAGTRVMVPNTALMFLASSLALELLARTGRPRRHAVGRVVATAIVVMAAAFLAEDLSGLELGIDRLLADVEPTRPAPETALVFLLFGVALIQRWVESRPGATTSFHFTLPLARTARGTDAEERAAAV